MKVKEQYYPTMMRSRLKNVKDTAIEKRTYHDIIDVNGFDLTYYIHFGVANGSACIRT